MYSTGQRPLSCTPLVGRYLGAYQFGQLALALTLFHTFRILAGAGLNAVTREVAKDRTKTAQYLANEQERGRCGHVCSDDCVSFVRMMNYSTDTVSVIMLLALGLLPYSISALCEGVLQAWERMHYIAYANVRNTRKLV